MGRLVAFDVGRKRTGIAASDPLKLIPTPIGYMPTSQIIEWLKTYSLNEKVDGLVVGLPKQANNTPSESCKYIEPLVKKIKQQFPDLEVIRYDERFTSVIAQKTLIESGVPKMKRREKGLVDEVSAVVILRDFMESQMGKSYICNTPK